MKGSKYFPWFLLAAALSGPPTAAAAPSDADRAQARELVKDALKALDARDFPRALDGFQRADRLYHAPTVLLGIARASVGLKKLVAAQEAYVRLAREVLPPDAPEAFTAAVNDGRKELAALQPRIPSLLISVAGAKGAQVTLDGEPLAAEALGVRRPVDPGEHTIRATAPGFQPAEQKATAVEGAAQPLTVSLTFKAAAPGEVAPPAPTTPVEPAASGQGSWRKPVGYGSIAVGGAGLVFMGVTGVLALGKKSDLTNMCPGGKCPSDAQGTHDSYKSLTTLSTVGFAVGIVGVGAGIFLLLTAPTSEQTGRGPSISPALGWRTVGLTGVF